MATETSDTTNEQASLEAERKRRVEDGNATSIDKMVTTSEPSTDKDRRAWLLAHKWEELGPTLLGRAERLSLGGEVRIDYMSTEELLQAEGLVAQNERRERMLKGEPTSLDKLVGESKEDVMYYAFRKLKDANVSLQEIIDYIGAVSDTVPSETDHQLQKDATQEIQIMRERVMESFRQATKLLEPYTWQSADNMELVGMLMLTGSTLYVGLRTFAVAWNPDVSTALVQMEIAVPGAIGALTGERLAKIAERRKQMIEDGRLPKEQQLLAQAVTDSAELIQKLSDLSTQKKRPE